jgi:hypothetical protein
MRLGRRRIKEYDTINDIAGTRFGEIRSSLTPREILDIDFQNISGSILERGDPGRLRGPRIAALRCLLECKRQNNPGDCIDSCRNATDTNIEHNQSLMEARRDNDIRVAEAAPLGIAAAGIPRAIMMRNDEDPDMRAAEATLPGIADARIMGNDEDSDSNVAVAHPIGGRRRRTRRKTKTRTRTRKSKRKRHKKRSARRR